jgi:DNA primase
LTKPSSVQKAFLAEATSRYHESLRQSPAEEYLEGRSLNGPEIVKARLGYVENPMPGHHMFEGWLSIPYMRWSPGQGWSVIGMRFRCMEDHNHKSAHNGGKYMAHSGSGTHLYNTLSILKSEDEIFITEGELDALAACMIGLPAVGVPGADTWTPVFARMFKGYDKVWVLADGDKAGRDFAEKVKGTLSNVWVADMPDDHDVNSTIQELGKDFVYERVGRNVHSG